MVTYYTLRYWLLYAFRVNLRSLPIQFMSYFIFRDRLVGFKIFSCTLRFWVVLKLFLHCDTKFWNGLWYLHYSNFYYYCTCIIWLHSISLTLRIMLFFLLTYQLGWLAHLSRLSRDKCHHDNFWIVTNLAHKMIVFKQSI